MTSDIQLSTILYFSDYDKYQQVVNKFYKEYKETWTTRSGVKAAGTAMGTRMSTGAAVGTVMEVVPAGKRETAIENLKTNKSFEIQYCVYDWRWISKEDFNFSTIVTNIIPDGNEDFTVIKMKALNDCGDIQQGINIYMRQYVAKGFNI